ncbi:MAG TPA: mechanosensitive ion channel family protein [Candidatus Babeliales bacterium]|nr:mechanosensitive ion channel family protein [Candidatus Babeliales bacterium]
MDLATFLACYSSLILWAVRVVGLVIATVWGVRYIQNKLKNALTKMYSDQLRIALIGKLFAYISFFILAVSLLHEFGLNVSALLGAAGVISIAIGYASQTSIANIISGLFLMIERPFKLGDMVVIGGERGRVAEVNLFAVLLHTESGVMVRIPHEKILKNKSINLTSLPIRRHTVQIKVGCQNNPQEIVAIIKRAIGDNVYCVMHPEPYILMREIIGNYLYIAVGAWGMQKHFTDIKHTLLLSLKEAFDKENIKMIGYKFGSDK